MILLADLFQFFLGWPHCHLPLQEEQLVYILLKIRLTFFLVILEVILFGLDHLLSMAHSDVHQISKSIE